MSRPAIPWTDLTPTPDTSPLRGGSGVVYRASWLRTGAPPLPVAVKLLRCGLLPGSVSYEDEAGKVETETLAVALAMEGDMGGRVTRLCGVARGDPTKAWLDVLGEGASSILSPTSAAGNGARELLGLITRWEEGGTLYDLLHSPMRSWGGGAATRLRLCAMLAEGLSCLHAKGIVHGNISSSNVLLADRGEQPRPLYSGFGISVLCGEEDAENKKEDFPRGTWPYMAPEMFRSRATAALAASRTSDVYALGTLCWEVLTGRQPWEGFTEADRRDALRSGEGLDIGSPPLPLDTPLSVTQMLAQSINTDRSARPKSGGMASVLSAAVEDLAAGEYDVYLSHAWVSGRRSPLTIEVYNRLRDAGLRVCIGADMGLRFEDSMRISVAKSRCVVALTNQHYSERPNCIKELEFANEMRKVVIGCFTEPGIGGTWWNKPELKGLIDPAVSNMVNLVLAAGVDWEGTVPAKEREKLTRYGDALPKLLRLVQLAKAEGAAPVLPLPVLALPPPERPSDTSSVFISYNWSAKPFAVATTSLLASYGITFWRDDERVLPSDTMFKRLAEGLSACTVVLVFLTPEYVSSANCAREIQFATAFRKPLLVLKLPGIDCPPPLTAGAFAAEIGFALSGTTWLAADGITPPATQLLPALAALGIARPLLRTIPWSQLQPTPDILGLGTYGTARVFTWTARGGLRVAVKELSRAATSMLTPADIAAFHREAQLQAQLEHDHVARVYAVAADEVAAGAAAQQLQRYGLVMQLYERPLSALLGACALPPPLRASLVLQLASGLAYMHGEGIVHGDLKPDNVLLDAGGRRAAITDFGLSTLKLAGSLSSGTNKGAGTDAFKAPELLQEDADGNPVHGVSSAADVYAFAVTAWCVLSDSVTPYPLKDAAGVVIKVVRRVPAGLRPGEGLPGRGLPAEWLGLLERCWAGAAGQRPSAGEVLAAARGLVGQGGEAEGEVERMVRETAAAAAAVSSRAGASSGAGASASALQGGGGGGRSI